MMNYLPMDLEETSRMSFIVFSIATTKWKYVKTEVAMTQERRGWVSRWKEWKIASAKRALLLFKEWISRFKYQLSKSVVTEFPSFSHNRISFPLFQNWFCFSFVSSFLCFQQLLKLLGSPRAKFWNDFYFSLPCVKLQDHQSNAGSKSPFCSMCLSCGF